MIKKTVTRQLTRTLFSVGHFISKPLFSFTVYTFLSSQPRSIAPHTPRIILLGASGSGKGVQASLLANKYNIVNGKYGNYSGYSDTIQSCK